MMIFIKIINNINKYLQEIYQIYYINDLFFFIYKIIILFIISFLFDKIFKIEKLKIYLK